MPNSKTFRVTTLDGYSKLLRPTLLELTKAKTIALRNSH